MKNKDLIAALSKLDPEATVLINVKQYNKAYGVIQIGISDSDAPYTWVNATYSGATITVHLPSNAFISFKKEKLK